MSRETVQWLNTNVLRGFTAKRGRAWHYSAAAQDGMEPNHYDGAIPMEDLERRLFGWRAVPRPLYMETASGITTIDGHVAWVRSDTDELLGIHTDGYNGHQYSEWLVRNVETMVGGVAQIANAGLLKNGAVAWVQIERPDNVSADYGISIRPFITATTSFDGSIATLYKEGYVDVVCDNTREMMLCEPGAIYRVKHTKNSAFNIADAQRTLTIVTESALAEIHTLTGVEVSDVQWSAFVSAHAPITEESSKRSTTLAENQRAELTKLWNTDTRVAPWRGTAWGVIQAVNTYNTHLSIVRNVTTRFERNMLNNITGKTGQADRDAVKTLETVLGRPLVNA